MTSLNYEKKLVLILHMYIYKSAPYTPHIAGNNNNFILIMDHEAMYTR